MHPSAAECLPVSNHATNVMSTGTNFITVYMRLRLKMSGGVLWILLVWNLIKKKNLMCIKLNIQDIKEAKMPKKIFKKY